MTVAELAWSQLTSEPESAATSMRSGPLRQRARWSEPAAASVGLARGGWPIGTRVEAHVGGAVLEGLPEPAVIVAVNGQALDAAGDWTSALANLGRLASGILYFSALTLEDWRFIADRSRTDGEVALRPAAWYRRRLARNFIEAGAGFWIRRGANVTLWSLETTERASHRV